MFLVAFQPGWYVRQFSENNVFSQIETSVAITQNQNLLGYLLGRESLATEFYTDREILHLTDVRHIISFWQIAGSGLLLVVAISVASLMRQDSRSGFRVIGWAGAVTLLTFIGLGLVLLFWFQQLFLGFHLTAFRNEFWLLDPATENLIVLYPPELFAALIRRINLTAMAVAFGLVVGGFALGTRPKS